MATELFSDMAEIRRFVKVNLDDTALEYIVDTVDQDMLDFAGPHSGSHTVNGCDGQAVLQPRADASSGYVLDPVQTHEVSELLVTVNNDDPFTVTYTVDTNEVRRRRGVFIELLKLWLGYNPQGVSLPTGLEYSTTPPYNDEDYNRVLKRLQVG